MKSISSCSGPSERGCCSASSSSTFRYSAYVGMALLAGSMAACATLHVLERLREVGHEVGGALDADRRPYQIIGDAELFAPRVRHAQVRHRCRMRCEALRATQA